MEPNDLKIERTRFASVMVARKTDRELIELFDKLDSSDKFAPAAKPFCFGDLVVEATRRVKEAQFPALLQAIHRYAAVRQIRAMVPTEEGSSMLRPLVARMFARAPKEEKALMGVFRWCEAVGVPPAESYTPDARSHVIALGIEGGISMADMDDICDITFHAYYPHMPRRELALA